jgi:hypothetical protein
MAKMALIFGPPGGGKMGKEEEKGDGEYDSDIPADFRDHCDAAFDALKKGRSSDFCEELWLTIKAYEETPHEENESDETDDEENEPSYGDTE